MSLRLPQSSYSVIVGCVTALLTPGMVMGAPVVIHTGDAVEMTGGTYQFDSLTIEPGGFLAFTGSTTLNVTGDVIIGHDTVSVTYEDPDTHQIITRTEDRYGQLYVELALTGLPLSLSQGARVAPGADGTNGSGGTLFPLASTPGGPGGNGGSGASLSYSIVGNGNLGLNINGGGAVTIDGIIHQEVFLLPDNHPAASGGPGGVGGHGGNGDTSLDPNAKGDGSAAGSGGHGGSGGSGASTKPFHIAINAATDVSVGPTGQLFNVNDFGGGANGGRGGDGGQGGSGTFHAAPGPDGGAGRWGPWWRRRSRWRRRRDRRYLHPSAEYRLRRIGLSAGRLGGQRRPWWKRRPHRGHRWYNRPHGRRRRRRERRTRRRWRQSCFSRRHRRLYERSRNNLPARRCRRPRQPRRICRQWRHPGRARSE